METLVSTGKQMIIQLGDLVPHVSVTLCQLLNNLGFFPFNAHIRVAVQP